jgi:polyhydroxyalkanoate synthesis repressor PhaR
LAAIIAAEKASEQLLGKICMVLIKRYPNRKLYNTAAKQYVTLAGVAELVLQGHEIEVVDNSTGEDLTAFTLTQIILEQERNRDGLLTHSFLVDLIRSRGERIIALKNELSSAVHFWRRFDEELALRLQNLVRSGEISEQEASNITEKLLSPPAAKNSDGRLSQDIFLADIETFLTQNLIPTRDDLQKLNNQLDDLSQKLADINNNQL